MPIAELAGARAAFHQTGGRSNRQYLHEVVLVLGADKHERTLCDAPDDADDKRAHEELAARIERFVHAPELATLEATCDLGRTAPQAKIFAVLNWVFLLPILWLIARPRSAFGWRSIALQERFGLCASVDCCRE